jgi:hypothetical protein
MNRVCRMSNSPDRLLGTAHLLKSFSGDKICGYPDIIKMS